MNVCLKNENRINEPTAKTQEHLTILGLKCSPQIITASLSDGRKVTIPTACLKDYAKQGRNN